MNNESDSTKADHTETGETAVSYAQDIERLQAALEATEKSQPGSQGHFSNSLAFESGLERNYLAHRNEMALPLIRAAIALAVVIYIGFLGSDALFFQHYQYGWIYAIVFIGCVPINAVLLLATFLPRWHPQVPTLSWLAALINALSLSLVTAFGVRQGVVIPHEILTLQLFYDFFLLALPWRVATPIVAFSVFFCIVANYLAGQAAQPLFLHGYFYTVAAILGSIGCYLIESAQRLAWLRARLLKELSEHDPLTGIYNRRVFFDRGEALLRQSLRDGRGVAVLLVDVDHFKKFNDAHGHLAGDDCLRLVARTLRQVARRPLDMAARIGGEEFAVLLYDSSRAAALERAEELRAQITGATLAHNLRVTASIGVASADLAREEPLQALVGRADAALYRAKHAGRDRVSE